jgi:hypothetical protein
LTNTKSQVGLEVIEVMTVKNRKIIFPFALLVLVSFLISACGQKEPTLDIDAQKTGFAQTADVQATMTAEAQPTATNTPEPTLTPTPTETPAGGTATQTPNATTTGTGGSAPIGGTDVGIWRSQDPPDNTKFSPGKAFTVIWTLENTGSSTWTTNYYIEFASGEQMGAEDKVFLPYNVPPATSAQIAVDFVAPGTPGEYQSTWNLVNANGNAFYSNFYIIIDVVSD